MSTSLILLIVALIGLAGYVLGARQARRLAAAALPKMHSRPGYYGSYVAVWAGLPALLILAVWLVASPIYVNSSIRDNFPEDLKAQTEAAQSLTFGTIGSVARGLTVLTPEEVAQAQANPGELRVLLGGKGVPLAGDPEPFMVSAAAELNAMNATSRLAMTIAVIAASVVGFFYAYRMIAPRFRARNKVEQVILASLITASCIAILTTVGIVASMLTEAIQFFQMVPAWEFFFGTVWDPRFAAAGATDSAGQFGLIPLLAGTLYIGFVAMVVAVPVGIFSAIYMAEYASPRMRSAVKPLLEVLAGIPTIVYGFFALTTVGPFLRDLSTQLNGIATGNYSNFIQAQSVITAGFVMGIMLIPYVSSLSDDIITAVPRALRDGSLGLGATRSETIKRVVLPAALPGIVGALLMTASRAIGETMIVVLAAGVAARMQINPFEPMTTVTVKIVSQLTGDLEFTSPQTLVAFALGITLFAITLCLNIYALYIVRKYREQYE
ncbi:phosphate ABC transporter permease subunit PstC [Neorhizobium sp. T786]|uniref:phosphate ABC transporter permease subunit PstC n=1 Tax=Pseudorhizobium xiangyangii TaxID=2883104 RepID=UPI001CFF95D1|nr:phosphate ABC transporter permease subunit PstC [Neorhizobium xiangyangii]MCB5201407.1 phosphate ABC transporter permease subunit PstC [Neorhizobium xiangyangii]